MFILSECLIKGSVWISNLTANTHGGYNRIMNSALKKRAVRRLKIVSGQIRGLEKMINDNKYCVDIIHQSLAIKEALSSLEDFILENHLTTHVVRQMMFGEKKKAVKEILTLYKLSKNK